MKKRILVYLPFLAIFFVAGCVHYEKHMAALIGKCEAAMANDGEFTDNLALED